MAAGVSTSGRAALIATRSWGSRSCAAPSRFGSRVRSSPMLVRCLGTRNFSTGSAAWSRSPIGWGPIPASSPTATPWTATASHSLLARHVWLRRRLPARAGSTGVPAASCSWPSRARSSCATDDADVGGYEGPQPSTTGLEGRAPSRPGRAAGRGARRDAPQRFGRSPTISRSIFPRARATSIPEATAASTQPTLTTGLRVQSPARKRFANPQRTPSSR